MIDLSDIGNVNKLIKGCIESDRKSQQTFYQAFYGKMLSVCMRYADNREEAKDMLHDGFIKVFASLNDFEFKGSLEGWIRKIVTNTAIDTVRKKKNFIVELEENHNYDHFFDDNLETKEQQEFVTLKAETMMLLIQKLSPMYRTVFNLYVFEDLSHKEIAEQLNINIGTSKSNYAKAKKNLIKLFEDYTNEHQQ